MKTLFVSLLALTPFLPCMADECQTGSGIATPYGRLIGTRCVDNKGSPLRQSVSLDKRKLIEDATLRQELTADKSGTYWIYTGSVDPKTYCPANLYLIDLSTTPPTSISFGVKNACNKFQWATWGKSGSVIALKNNVRFRYKDGKLTPPKADEGFLQAIELPEDAPSTGVVAESIIPFVRPVASPNPA